MQLSAITKAVVNVCTLVVAVGTPILSHTTGMLPLPVSFVISSVVAAAGAVVHYLAPNTTTDPHVAATQSVRLDPPRTQTRKGRDHRGTTNGPAV